MKERPIIMSGENPRRVLDGTKTQTRRLVDLERLRVRLPEPVASDPYPGERPFVAARGIYPARMNPHGAVVITVNASVDGGRARVVSPPVELGVKPGEFHFVCPYADGTTHLADHGTGRKVWTITPDPDQRLWIREAHAQFSVGEGLDRPVPQCVAYRATCDEDGGFDYVNGRDEIMRLKVTRWTPPIFMPRWASRATVDVTQVRLERLQAITEDDARAEAVERFFTRFPEIGRDQRLTSGELARAEEHRASYAVSWDEINGDRALWSANPWVWAIAFKGVEAR